MTLMDGPAITAAPIVAPPAVTPARKVLRSCSTAIGWGLLIATLVAGSYYGLSLRRWAWDQTEAIRFTSDIRNGFTQGSRVVSAARRLGPAGSPTITWPNFFSAFHDT